MSRPDWKREGSDWPNRDASRFVAAGGVRWHVQITGEGPALLLLHGTGAATHSWRDMLPLLADRFTVIAPDLPGHGFSGPLPGAATLPSMARALAALLAELDAAPDMIVGHSAGAAIAVQTALDGALSPSAIVSINGALLPFPGLAAKLFPGMAKLLFLNPMTPRIMALQARMSGEVGRFLLRSTGSRIDDRGAALYGRLFAHSGHVAGALGMMANWDLDRFAARLPDLDIPLLLVAAENDMAIPAGTANRVADMTDAGVERLPGLGHLAHEERPDLLADIVVRAARKHAILRGKETGA